MKTLILVALTLPLLLQEQPRPAWEIAPSWRCQMDRLRICQGAGGDCAVTENSAVSRIDFTANVFSIGDERVPKHPIPPPAAHAPPDTRERIVGRNFYPGLYSAGFSKIVLNTGDSATLATTPDKEGAYPAIINRAQIHEQYQFYGTCRPD